MYLITLTKQILYDMLAFKMRYSLTIFGIAWGTITVTLRLALGNGFNQQGAKELSQIAEGAFFLVPGAATKNFLGNPKGKPLNIKADVLLIYQKKSLQ